MLNQLIESKSNAAENRKRGGFLLTVFMLVFALCFSAVLFSLFAKNLETGDANFDLQTLVAPLAENAPAALPKEEKRELAAEPKNATITRTTNQMRIDETQPAPDKISVTPNAEKSRPNGKFIISDQPGIEGTQSSSFSKNKVGSDGEGISLGNQTSSKMPENTQVIAPPPAPVKKNPVETNQKPNIIKTSGVINGKAKFLPKPIYTAAAKAIRANGDVNVQVTIDEQGNVIAANAVSGHPILRNEAEKAARNAKFNPTLLSNQPVKVTGIIVYKFSMQ